MDALSYEYLIRAAFNCGRKSRHGADADIYRGLENTIDSVHFEFVYFVFCHCHFFMF